VEKIFRYFSELSGTDLNPEVLAGFQNMLLQQGVQAGEDALAAPPEDADDEASSESEAAGEPTREPGGEPAGEAAGGSDEPSHAPSS
jgi:hypothetical protein